MGRAAHGFDGDRCESGAIIPVIPFMFTTGTVAIVAAAIVSLVAHFLVGAAKSLVTLRSW